MYQGALFTIIITYFLVQAQDVEEYLCVKSKFRLRVEQLESRHRVSFNSFVVKVPTEHLSTFMKEDLWPKGIVYRRFRATCINVYNCKPRHCPVRAHIDAGWLCGKVLAAEDGTRYASFKGVPYGKPPLGIRRFKELEPVEPWDENLLLDTTEDAPACPQSDFIYGRMPLQTKGMSEDCIYLNINVPYETMSKPPCHHKGHGLPIVVFIHGGAFQSGAGLSDILGPEYMMMKPVIVITFNYRLNVFGFLCLNTKELPCNQGLRDMVALLRWVHRNAHSFGGDPNNVTLMGQSAGATSAHILSLSNATKGLFKRVIMMSCTAFPSYYTTSTKYMKKISRMFFKELGINQTDPVLIHRELVKLPLLKIMNANAAVQYDTDIVACGPAVEPEIHGVTRILDADPLTLIAQGRGRKYPVLLSYTNNEMAIFKWYLARKSMLERVKQDNTEIVSPRLLYTLPKKKVKEIANKIIHRYFNGNPTLDGLVKYYTDMHFKHPALKVAQWRAASGAAPTYMYKFAYDFEYSPVKAAHWANYTGSAHMDDLACVFRLNSMQGKRIYYPPKNTDDTMKHWMVYIITNFMICSNPTCNSNSLWPPVSKTKIQYNLITAPMKIHMMEPTIQEKDMVKFFDSFDTVSRNISTTLGAAC